MGWESTTAIGSVLCGPGYEYFLLAERVHRCAVELDEIIGRLHGVDQLHWQSPAGAGLRQCLAEQRRSLLQLQQSFGPAEAAITRLGDIIAAEHLTQLAWAPP